MVYKVLWPNITRNSKGQQTYDRDTCMQLQSFLNFLQQFIIQPKSVFNSLNTSSSQSWWEKKVQHFIADGLFLLGNFFFCDWKQGVNLKAFFRGT